MIIGVHEVKEHCQITADDLNLAEDDYTDYIEADVIPAATAIIEDYCNVPSTFFEDTGVTITDEYHDHDGSGIIYLQYYPVVVTTLSVNSLALTAVPSWTALTAHPAATSDFISYLEYKYHGKIYIYNGAPSAGIRNIKVTYKAGYATTPAPVELICKELASALLRGMLKRKLTPQDVTQIVMAGGDIRSIFAEDLKMNSLQKKVLDSYKISKVRGRRG